MRLSKQLDKLRDKLNDLRYDVEHAMSWDQIAEFDSISDEMWGIVCDLENIGEQL